MSSFFQILLGGVIGLCVGSIPGMFVGCLIGCIPEVMRHRRVNAETDRLINKPGVRELQDQLARGEFDPRKHRS